MNCFLVISLTFVCILHKIVDFVELTFRFLIQIDMFLVRNIKSHRVYTRSCLIVHLIFEEPGLNLQRSRLREPAGSVPGGYWPPSILVALIHYSGIRSTEANASIN